MLKSLIKKVAAVITVFIAHYGYGAIILLMGLESCNIPIPSEVILPYAGFLISQRHLNFHLAALAGALGCLLGSWLSYFLGQKVGRPFLWSQGKWLLISHKDIDQADKFIKRYGSTTYFFSRLLPVVRTFISFIAGVSEGNFLKFSIYTFLGSWVWSYFLVYVGIKLGDHWEALRPLWDKFQIAIIALILLAITWHIIRVFKQSRPKKDSE